jgi:hypothetical protein
MFMEITRRSMQAGRRENGLEEVMPEHGSSIDLGRWTYMNSSELHVAGCIFTKRRSSLTSVEVDTSRFVVVVLLVMVAVADEVTVTVTGSF